MRPARAGHGYRRQPWRGYGSTPWLAYTFRVSHD